MDKGLATPGPGGGLPIARKRDGKAQRNCGGCCTGDCPALIKYEPCPITGRPCDTQPPPVFMCVTAMCGDDDPVSKVVQFSGIPGVEGYCFRAEDAPPGHGLYHTEKCVDPPPDRDPLPCDAIVASDYPGSTFECFDSCFDERCTGRSGLYVVVAWCSGSCGPSDPPQPALICPPDPSKCYFGIWADPDDPDNSGCFTFGPGSPTFEGDPEDRVVLTPQTGLQAISETRDATSACCECCADCDHELVNNDDAGKAPYCWGHLTGDVTGCCCPPDVIAHRFFFKRQREYRSVLRASDGCFSDDTTLVTATQTLTTRHVDGEPAECLSHNGDWRQVNSYSNTCNPNDNGEDVRHCVSTSCDDLRFIPAFHCTARVRNTFAEWEDPSGCDAFNYGSGPTAYFDLSRNGPYGGCQSHEPYPPAPGCENSGDYWLGGNCGRAGQTWRYLNRCEHRDYDSDTGELIQTTVTTTEVYANEFVIYTVGEHATGCGGGCGRKTPKGGNVGAPIGALDLI